MQMDRGLVAFGQLAGFAGVSVSGFLPDALLRAKLSFSASRNIPAQTSIALSALIVSDMFDNRPTPEFAGDGVRRVRGRRLEYN